MGDTEASGRGANTTTPPWPHDTFARIPAWIYTEPCIYRRELERIFYGRHWNYVGLEAEVPRPGDFKETKVGERSVIVVRTGDGSVSVVENRCAHRGVQFCQERSGHAQALLCPYHKWTYDLKGNLIGLPFRRGIKGRGGMPAAFRLAEHSLTKLRVAVRHGVVFASFDHSVESLENYLGPEVLFYFDRLFDGRKLALLGYSRQRIPSNWKLMQENIKDPYHPGLLHTWFSTFGLWRADQESQMIMDARGRHACMIARRDPDAPPAFGKGVSSTQEPVTLNDARLLDIVPEPWWNGPTVVMITIFPSIIIQQQVNSLSTRHLQPVGPDAFDFTWTHFGFADDDAEMTRRRLRQANLFGPAGFVSADDGEVLELSQKGFRQDRNFYAVCELGGRDVAPADHMITETLIRGMYRYWREIMGV